MPLLKINAENYPVPEQEPLFYDYREYLLIKAKAKNLAPSTEVFPSAEFKEYLSLKVALQTRYGYPEHADDLIINRLPVHVLEELSPRLKSIEVAEVPLHIYNIIKIYPGFDDLRLAPETYKRLFTNILSLQFFTDEDSPLKLFYTDLFKTTVICSDIKDPILRWVTFSQPFLYNTVFAHVYEKLVIHPEEVAINLPRVEE